MKQKFGLFLVQGIGFFLATALLVWLCLLIRQENVEESAARSEAYELTYATASHRLYLPDRGEAKQA